MGYIAVLTLDDRIARSTDPAELGRDLLELVQGHTYPVGGLEAVRRGAWQRVGAFHSTEQAVIAVDTGGGHVVDVPQEFPAPLGWQAVLSTGAIARRTRELLAHPAGLARHPDWREAVVGANRLEHGSIRSVWSLHLDALGWHHPDPAELGAWVLAECGQHTAERSGPFGASLAHIGGLLAGGEVLVVASGNRVAAFEDLTERERELLEARAARTEHRRTR